MQLKDIAIRTNNIHALYCYFPFHLIVSRKMELCDTSLKCALIGRSHFSLFLLLDIATSREMQRRGKPLFESREFFPNGE